MASPYTIRMLTADDVQAFVEHSERHFAEGHEEEIPYGPYGRNATEPRSKALEKARERWGLALNEPTWRRVFGLWHEDDIVGTVSLTGGDLPASLHRVNLGLGIERAHRRKGFGRQLMDTAISYARQTPSIAWIDLGVFGGNVAAEALYRKLGFEVVGVTKDLFRVDDKSIDNTHMVLNVESLTDA